MRVPLRPSEQEIAASEMGSNGQVALQNFCVTNGGIFDRSNLALRCLLILRATWGDDAPPSLPGAISCNGKIPASTQVQLRQAMPPHEQGHQEIIQTDPRCRCPDRAVSKVELDRNGVWQ